MTRVLPALAIGLLLAGLAGCGVSATPGGAPAHPPPLFHLPADQAAHPSTHNEWWYVVGHVDQGKQRFGYEVTIFRFHQVKLPGFNIPLSIFRTDVAITDETGERFSHKVTEVFPQEATASTSVLDVRAGPATLTGSSPADMRVHATLPGGTINLHLNSEAPPLAVGGRGYISLGNGYSYYYSLTDLASHGTIDYNGHTFRVHGISWLDHQWGNWAWTSIRGWTWMALQLTDGRQLSLFDFRGTHSRVRQANLLTAGGETKVAQNVTIEPITNWRSPVTLANYPSGWKIRIPAFNAKLTVEPSVRDQEVTLPEDLAGSYWEGSGQVSGTLGGKRVKGYSYT
ncbi:MAG: lipocalin-like domain-containing protein, partial [Chloroflexota bacterium]